MRIMQIMVVVLSATLLGCMTVPTQEQVASADIGPKPENAQQVVKDYFARTLYDPYSAVYTFNYGPERASHTGLGTTIGWFVCGTLNAKNRLGGYVGAKPFRVVIVKGAVVEDVSLVGDYVVCK